jgi:hypothetical protein
MMTHAIALVFVLAGSDPAPAEPPVIEGAAEEIIAAPLTETTAPMPSQSVTTLVAPAPSGVDPVLTDLGASTVTLRNVTRALGLSQSAELSHNPYYATVLRFDPRWQATQWLSLSGHLDLTNELTTPDWTSDHSTFGDLEVAASIDELYVIPVVLVTTSVGASIEAPTSKRSRAESKVLATGVSGGLERRFGVLGGLTVSSSVALTKNWHQYTTPATRGELESTGDCDIGANASCAQQVLSSGARNASWLLDLGVGGALKINDVLSARAAFRVVRAGLYRLTPDPRISYTTVETSDAQHYLISDVGVRWKPMPLLSLGAGAATLAPQLRPDGQYRTPGLNRYTQIYVDVSVSLDAALNAAGFVTEG